MPNTPEEAAAAAERRAAREAAAHLDWIAHNSTPDRIEWRKAHIAWMRNCRGASHSRYAVGAEMDGRDFSDHEIASQERMLAECEAHAAAKMLVAA